MNRKIMQGNAEFRRQPLTGEALADTIKNCKTTEIDIDKVDLDRALEIADLLCPEHNGIVKPLPFSVIANDTVDTLNLVLQYSALYTFPVVELIDFLKGEIDDDPELEPHTAIEICAGMGWIGRGLGIPITDSRIQERDDVRSSYLANRAVPIQYPDDVECLDAVSAVKKYAPEFVIGSYVTRLYGLGSLKQGSSFGVDTPWLVNNCRRFYHIGNDDVHYGDPIMKRPHQRLKFDWLVTRGNSEHARIYVWENKQW